MRILLIKSLLSVVMTGITILSAWSMFELLGRADREDIDAKRLKRIHRASGITFFAIYIFVAYFCLRYIVASRIELSPRGNAHALLALAVPALFFLKLSFVRLYKKFYARAITLGMAMAILTFAMVSTSGGYYLFVTGFGKDKTFDRIYENKMRGREVSGVDLLSKTGEGAAVEEPRTDRESIFRGEKLFRENCSLCHDPASHKTVVGPGLSGVLKNPELPVSGRKATAENVRRQLESPFRNMPSFAHLSDDQVEDIIAYLNTL